MNAGVPPIGSRESTTLAQPKSVGPDGGLREAASVPDGLVGERAAGRDLEEAGAEARDGVRRVPALPGQSAACRLGSMQAGDDVRRAEPAEHAAITLQLRRATGGGGLDGPELPGGLVGREPNDGAIRAAAQRKAPYAPGQQKACLIRPESAQTRPRPRRAGRGHGHGGEPGTGTATAASRARPQSPGAGGGHNGQWKLRRAQSV